MGLFDTEAPCVKVSIIINTFDYNRHFDTGCPVVGALGLGSCCGVEVTELSTNKQHTVSPVFIIHAGFMTKRLW